MTFIAPTFAARHPTPHYVSMGRWCTILGVFVSIGTAYSVMRSESIMDYCQALFSFFTRPCSAR